MTYYVSGIFHATIHSLISLFSWERCREGGWHRPSKLLLSFCDWRWKREQSQVYSFDCRFGPPEWLIIISSATISIISVAVYYAFTQFQYYEVPLSAMAKLYSNTMLVAVNSRVRFKVMSESTTWKDVAVLSLHFQSSDDCDTEGPQSRRQQDTMVFAERRGGSMEAQRRKTQDMVRIDVEGWWDIVINTFPLFSSEVARRADAVYRRFK